MRNELTSSSWKRRDFLRSVGLGAAALGTGALSSCGGSRSGPPNFVVIFLDDSGYGDFHPFGNPPYPTPNVARLAQGGCRFTNFYVPQAVCSASRSALLSGCYPGRTKVFGAHGPRARGLDPSFATMGEVLKTAGYATGTFGKWHIGDQPDTRPPARGFDESSGLMYSNDMWEYHPERPENFREHALQFWKNGEITVERVTPEDQPNLTTWGTEHAVDFINRHKQQPFLCYVPYSMPHVPLFVSDKFKGKSGVGLYADVMMEIDWGVGQILDALRDNGLEENTMVVFTSDNGPWTGYGNHAGTTPFREAKGTGFDGGTRSATIMRYPGKINAGSVSARAACTVDLMPTFAHLAGAQLPSHPVDGKNLWNLFAGTPGAVNPHEYYPFSTGRVFEGVLSGDGNWKLHLPHSYRVVVEPANDGAAGKYEQAQIELSLFDMQNDPKETTNVIDKHPEVAQRLQEFARQHQQEFYAEA
ncbi:MAG: sulfatase [Bryobacterales bacterium]|nr:sulfatase [Bryobacterales bacterium]